MSTTKKPSSAWQPGTSGNPAGKPKGAKHHATRMIEKLLEDGAAEIAKTVVDQAKAGDMTAARMVLDRLAPAAKERAITLELPSDTSTAAGISAAHQAVLEAVSRGELTPGEGATLAGILEGRRKALETQELEQRIAALEAKS